MAQIRNLKPGQIVYDVSTTKMGNTSLRTVSVWSVAIKEIDANGKFVVASWNGNTPKKFYPPTVSRWKIKPPTLVSTGFSGRMRRATRAELAEMKAKAAPGLKPPAQQQGEG